MSISPRRRQRSESYADVSVQSGRSGCLCWGVDTKSAVKPIGGLAPVLRGHCNHSFLLSTPALFKVRCGLEISKSTSRCRPTCSCSCSCTWACTWACTWTCACWPLAHHHTVCCTATRSAQVRGSRTPQSIVLCLQTSWLSSPGTTLPRNLPSSAISSCSPPFATLPAQGTFKRKACIDEVLLGA